MSENKYYTNKTNVVLSLAVFYGVALLLTLCFIVVIALGEYFCNNDTKKKSKQTKQDEIEEQLPQYELYMLPPPVYNDHKRQISHCRI